MAECHRALARASDEQHLYEQLCRILTGPGGYQATWVGRVEHDARKSITPLAQSGYPPDYFDLAEISWSADTPRGRGPAGKAVRTGIAQQQRNIDIRRGIDAWRASVEDERNPGSALLIPLKESEQVVAVLGVVAGEKDAFDADEVALLEQLAADVAYGRSNLRHREAQRHAEQKVAESERRYHATFDLVPVGINHIEPEGTIVLANRRFEQMLGYGPGELTGRNIRELRLNDDSEYVRRLLALRKQLYEGAIDRFTTEHLYRRKDGVPVWVEVTITLMRDAAGEPLHDVSAVVDITERKRAEQLQRIEHAVARALARAEDAEGGTAAVIRGICSRDQWECGRYYEVDDAAGVLRLAVSWGISDPAIERFISEQGAPEFKPGMGLVGCAWQSGQPIWSEDAQNDPRSLSKHLGVDTWIRSVFAFPVTSGVHCIGVLVLFSRMPREADERVLLASSTRFMNESGPSYASLAAKHHIEPGHLVAVYDELDIPAGELRVKVGGGSSHNGVKSLQQSMRGRDFLHVRIGIGRPPGRQDPADFVLAPIPKKLEAEVAIWVDRAADAVRSLIADGLASTQDRFNRQAP